MSRFSKRFALLACGGLTLAATAAVAGSTVGGVFNLGTTNTVNARTTLSGSTTTHQLFVSNTSDSPNSAAVVGSSIGGVGVVAFTNSRFGLHAAARAATGATFGVYSTAASRDGLAGFFRNTNSATTSAALHVMSGGATGNEFRVGGYAGAGKFAGPNGLIGAASVPGGAGVIGLSDTARGIGVFGRATAADGLAGLFQNTRGAAILGLAGGATVGDRVNASAGGEFVGPFGVVGATTASEGTGVLALQGIGRWALVASGDANVTDDLDVNGTLSKGAGSFKIDHPLDPANKYLSHSFVESPDMMNIYNGNVTTDATGAAVVQLPGYFGALNRDPRYQLTVIGSPDVAYIAKEISGNAFTIQTREPGVKVSWQVTGIRRDAYAVARPIVVEEDKVSAERGRYLHPEAHGKPADLAIGPGEAPSHAAALPQPGAIGG